MTCSDDRLLRGGRVPFARSSGCEPGPVLQSLFPTSAAENESVASWGRRRKMRNEQVVVVCACRVRDGNWGFPDRPGPGPRPWPYPGTRAPNGGVSSAFGLALGPKERRLWHGDCSMLLTLPVDASASSKSGEYGRSGRGAPGLLPCAAAGRCSGDIS